VYSFRYGISRSSSFPCSSSSVFLNELAYTTFVPFSPLRANPPSSFASRLEPRTHARLQMGNNRLGHPRVNIRSCTSHCLHHNPLKQKEMERTPCKKALAFGQRGRRTKGSGDRLSQASPRRRGPVCTNAAQRSAEDGEATPRGARPRALTAWGCPHQRKRVAEPATVRGRPRPTHPWAKGDVAYQKRPSTAKPDSTQSATSRGAPIFGEALDCLESD